jgi:hypothetical protein
LLSQVVGADTVQKRIPTLLVDIGEEVPFDLIDVGWQPSPKIPLTSLDPF